MADHTRKVANMNRTLLISAFLVLAQAQGFAQANPTAEELARARQEQAAAAQQRLDSQKEAAERQKSQDALRDFLNGPTRRWEPGAAAELEARFLEFRLAIPKFREATDEFRWNLSMKNKLEKPLKTLEVQTDVLLRYLSAAKVNHPRPNAQEFKDFSQTELEWETFSVAERIGSFLGLAVVVERRNVVAVETLEFMYTLDGELLRLKWLASHTR